MDGMELKLAYLNYIDGNLEEAIRLLDKKAYNFLGNDLSLERDPFWSVLSKEVFKAVILNKFYNNQEIFENDLYLLFSDYSRVKENVNEFCLNFYNNTSISFIPYFQKITDRMLESAIDTIRLALKKDC